MRDEIKPQREDLRERALKFALRVIRMVDYLPKQIATREVARQIVRSSTSIGANLEEAFAGLSKKDFVHSVNIARKEASETKYWLRIISESGWLSRAQLNGLLSESEEWIKILTSIVKKNQNRVSALLIFSSLIPWFLSLIFVLSLIPLISSLTFAYTSLGALRAGDELRGFSARSLAMGGTAIASSRDSAALFANPAILSQMDAGNSLSVSPGFATAFYDRTHPDSTAKKPSFSADSNSLFNLQSFAASVRHPRLSFLTIAAGWNASSNFDFDFDSGQPNSTLTRDRHDPENSGATPGRDTIKMRGNLAQWSAGLSFKPFSWISFGGAYLGATGRVRSETVLLTLKTGALPITQKIAWSNEFSGDNFLAGLAIHFSPTLILGVVFQPQFDLKIASTSSFSQGIVQKSSGKSNATFRMPARYGVGVLYGLKGSEKTLLAADVIYTQWERSRVTITSINDVPASAQFNPLFRDTIELHLGFEHWIKDKFPLRLGFYYLPDYLLAPTSETPFFTLGTGYKWKDFTVDVAGEFGRRTTSQDRFFFSGQRDEVLDTRLRFVTTLTYRWR